MPLSYSEAFRSPLQQRFVRMLERLTGVTQLQALYDRRQPYFDQGLDVFSTAMKLLDLTIDLRGYPLKQLPRTGPVVFVVNHPFGVIDGVVSCHLIHQVRTDFRVMIISQILQMEEMRPWVLPLDYSATAEAQSNNLRSRAEAIKTLRNGGAVVIYPAGEVATAPFVFGRAVEKPWHVFLGRLVQSGNASVVPIYIHGQNSWRFHFADRLGTPFRLAMLMHETRRLIGATIVVTIGRTIPYREIDSIADRREVVQVLQGQTISLAEAWSHQSPLSRKRGSPPAGKL
jgi:putative hemolysin